MAIKLFTGSITSSTSISCSITPAPITVTMSPATFACSSSMNIVRTSYISIFIQSLGISWVGGTTYTFNISSGFVKDAGGKQNSAQSMTLTIPTSGPAYSSISVPNNDYINITFNRNVYYNGSGTLSVFTSSGTLVTTVSSSLAKTSGATASFPVAGKLKANTSYYVTATSGLVSGDFLDASPTITGTSASFTTVSEPVFHDLVASLSSTSTVYCNPLKYRGFAKMYSDTSLYCKAGRVTHTSATLSSSSALTCQSNFLSFQISSPVANSTYSFNLYGLSSCTIYWGDGTNTVYSSSTSLGSTSNGVSPAVTSGITASHYYSTIGLYNIVVQSAGYKLCYVDFSGMTVTKVYDWGIWDFNNPDNTTIAYLMANQTSLTNLPNYLPPLIGSSSSTINYTAMLQGCTNFNDSNTINWFQSSGLQMSAPSGYSLTSNNFGTGSGTVPYSSQTWLSTAQSLSYNSNSISSSSFELNSGGFTIECWVALKPTATGISSAKILSTSTVQIYAGYVSGNWKIWLTVSGGSTITYSTSSTPGNLMHVAYNYEAGSNALYVNGSKVGTTTAYPFTSTPSDSLTINPGGIAYISEVRVSNTNRYGVNLSSTISVPTAQFVSDNSTALLLHFNGSISDSSYLENGSLANMDYMFQNCSKFNQDLSSWNVPFVNSHVQFSQGATKWALPQPSFPS